MISSKLPSTIHKLTFQTSEADLETWSGYFFDYGCQGICEKTPGNWEAHFEGNSDGMRAAAKSLKAMGLETQEVIEKNQDWLTEWRKHQIPFYLTLSRSFSVYPRQEGERLPAKYELWIEPKMTFGTGTHASTRLCSELIERHCQQAKSFVDVGTGTGILALVAAKLGIPRITACDTDPLSLRDAAENFRRNGCPNLDLFIGGVEALQPKAKFEAASANILSSTILEIAPALRNRVEGPIIFSGILQSEQAAFVAGIGRAGFTLVETLELEEWWACAAK